MRRISALSATSLAILLLISGPATAVDPSLLELRGVFASSEQARSTALLSIRGQAPLAARIGQPLPEGFSLQSIAHDHVLVARGGQRYRLALPNRTSGTADSTPAFAPAPYPIDASEQASGVYADACGAFANFDLAQREELQSLGICAQ